MKRRALYIGSIVLVIVVLAFVIIRVDPSAVWAALSTMSPAWGVAAAVVNLATVVAEAARWRIALKPVARVSLRRAFGALVIGFTTNLFLPYKLGDGARAWSLARWQAVPVATVVSTVVLDRAVDAVTFVLLAVALSSAVPLPGNVSSNLRRVEIALAVLVAIIAIGWWIGRRRASRASGAGGLVTRLVAGLAVLRHVREMPGLLGVAVLAWLGRGVVVWCMLHAFGLELPLVAVATTLAAINLGITVIATPGNFGVFELSAAGALALWNVPPAVGLSLGIALHALEVIPIATLGLITIAATRTTSRAVSEPVSNAVARH